MTEALTVVDGGAAGAWIAPRLEGGFGGKVKQQVPDGYEVYARVFHPAADENGGSTTWATVAEKLGRTAHREMQWHRLVGAADSFDTSVSEWPGREPRKGEMDAPTLAAVCEVLARHTSDAEHCFFGLSTIYGAVESSYPDAVQLRWPGRDFVTFAGPLTAIEKVGYDSGAAWVTDIYADGRRARRRLDSHWIPQPPNLIWPADHSWYVASEFDLDSTLVGGSRNLIDAILASPGLEAWEVERGDSLEAWADKIN